MGTDVMPFFCLFSPNKVCVGGDGDKLDADGHLVDSLELVVGELEQQTALAHTAVADEQELEQVVAV